RPGGVRQRAVRALQHLAEARQPEEGNREPDVAEDRGEQDRDERDRQPITQLVQVLDERHRPVGVLRPPACPTERKTSHRGVLLLRRGAARTRLGRARGLGGLLLGLRLPLGERLRLGRRGLVGRLRLRLRRLLLQALHLTLDHAGGLTDGPGHVRQALGTEQEHQDSDEDHQFPAAEVRHVLVLPPCAVVRSLRGSRFRPTPVVVRRPAPAARPPAAPRPPPGPPSPGRTAARAAAPPAAAPRAARSPRRPSPTPTAPTRPPAPVPWPRAPPAPAPPAAA